MKLTEEQKRFLVMGWARHMGNREIREAFLQRFGVEVTAQQALDYNPSTPARTGRSMHQGKWPKLFEETRAAYLADVASIPIAHAAHRLHRLNAMHDKAYANGNHRLAADFLEQAAKEAGGLYRAREADDARDKGRNAPVEAMDTDEQRATLAEALADSLARLTGGGATSH